jgi:hypothetical protein
MADDPLGLAGRTVTIEDGGSSTVSKAAPPHAELFDRIFGAESDELESY